MQPRPFGCIDHNGRVGFQNSRDRSTEGRAVVAVSPSVTRRGVDIDVIGAIEVISRNRATVRGAADTARPARIGDVGKQQVDVTAHVGCRRIVILPVVAFEYHTPIIHDADPCAVHHRKTVVCGMDTHLTGVGQELPYAPRGRVVGVDAVVGREQDDDASAQQSRPDRKGEPCAEDAVVALRRSLAADKSRHLDKLRIVAVLDGLQLDGVHIEAAAQELGVLNHRVHVDMSAGEHLAGDTAAGKLLVAQGAADEVAQQRVVVVAAPRVPHPRRPARRIGEVERIDQPVIGDIRDVGDGELDRQIRIVGMVDHHFIPKRVLVVVARVDGEPHVIERNSLPFAVWTVTSATATTAGGTHIVFERLFHVEDQTTVYGNAVDLDLLVGLGRSLGLLHHEAFGADPLSVVLQPVGRRSADDLHAIVELDDILVVSGGAITSRQTVFGMLGADGVFERQLVGTLLHLVAAGLDDMVLMRSVT